MFTFKPKPDTGRKPISQVKAADIFTRVFLDKMGKILVDNIVLEAKKDVAKQGNHSADKDHPVGLPRDEAFFKSFFFRSTSDLAVEILSSWPTIEDHIEGKKPYPMKWLTQQKGVTLIPFGEKNGKVIIRTAPKLAEDAWIHPGFQKHSFVSRGYDRSISAIEELAFERMTDVLMKSDLSR